MKEVDYMNGKQDVSRSVEKVLGVIGIVFNLLAIALIIFSIFSLGNVENEPEFREFLEEQIMSDPAMTDVGDVQGLVDGLLTSFDVIMWVLVGLLAISTLFAFLAIGRLGKNANPNMAGVFFIVAGLFAGVMSLTSILFYIAAIMCFVRKASNGNGKDLQDNSNLQRENDRLRDQDSLRHDDQRIREERVREEEQQRAMEERSRQSQPGTAGDDFVEREDLKRRADERLSKDNNDDTPYRPL